MSQGLGFLLQETQLLKMMWRQTHQVALPGHGDLQRLPNPPGRICRQARAMADVETVDGLHEATDSFLQ